MRFVLLNDSARSDKVHLLSHHHAEIWWQPRPEKDTGHVLMIADGDRSTSKPSANGTAVNGKLVGSAAASAHTQPHFAAQLAQPHVF